MSTTPFDDAAKALLQAALEPMGEVRIHCELRGNPRHADATFVPSRSPKARNLSGLLGRMTQRVCVIECYHKPPSVLEAYQCLDKRLRLWLLERKKIERAPLPTLWLVSAGRPRSMMKHFGLEAAKGWPRGVYQAEPRAQRLMLVVVPELGRSRSTLMCRLLGNVNHVKEALDDLSQLSPEAWELTTTLPLLSMLRSLNSSPKEKAIAMSAMTLYEQHRQRIIEEARAHIVEEARARLEKSLYEQHRKEFQTQTFKCLAEQKLGTTLSEAQQARLVAWLGEAGPERVGEVLLTWSVQEVERWLAE